MSVPGRKPDLVADRLPSSHSPRPDATVLAPGAVVELNPPEDMSDEAVEVWDIVVPALIRNQVLREEHVVMLIEACEAWALARRFRADLWQELHGLNDPDTVKKIRASWRAALDAAKSLSSELGISPVAQVRLGLLKAQGATLLDALAARHNEGSGE